MIESEQPIEDIEDAGPRVEHLGHNWRTYASSPEGGTWDYCDGHCLRLRTTWPGPGGKVHIWQLADEQSNYPSGGRGGS